MAPLVRKQTIKVNPLTAAERDALADELFPINDEVMAGADPEVFRADLETPAGTTTTVQIFRNAANEAVGYSVARRLELNINGRDIIVMRAAAAIKDQYRGGGSTLMLGFILSVLSKIQRPTSEVYYFGTLLQPTSYYLMTKFASVIWPNHKQQTPPEIEDLMVSIATKVGLEPLDEAYPLAFKTPRTVVETPEERQYWLTTERPEARCYLQHNPRYFDGSAMICLIPLDWRNLAETFATFVAEKIQANFQLIRGEVRFRLFGNRTVGTTELLRLLRHHEILSKLQRSTVEILSNEASIQSLKPGDYLMKQGDTADAAYILLKGTCDVMANRDNQEIQIAEVDTGAVVGEMGVIENMPRTASLKARTPARVLCISSTLLLKAIDDQPEIGEQIRTLIEARRSANETVSPAS